MEHLHNYWDANGIQAVDLETRYKLKEVGSHYIIDHMELSSTEKTRLKTTMSNRICAEQALETQLIPTRYLYQLLLLFPDRSKKMVLIELHLTLAELVSGDDANTEPAPFNLENDGPYTAVRQDGIVRIVNIAFGLTGIPIRSILNTPERMEAFNYGGRKLTNSCWTLFS